LYVADGLRLPTDLGRPLAERGAIGRDAKDGHDLRINLIDQKPQLLCSRHQLLRGQLVGPGRCSGHQVGDPDAPVPEMGEVGHGEPGRGVDHVIGDPGLKQGRIKAVSRSSKVTLNCDRPQPGIDPHEKDPDVRAEQIGQGAIPKCLELTARESHPSTLRADSTSHSARLTRFLSKGEGPSKEDQDHAQAACGG
jgi:hypothetical protein